VSELELPACPICHAENSLFRRSIEEHGHTFSGYECQECESILSQEGDERWVYLTVGHEDKEYLLNEPLTSEDLWALLPQTGAAEAPAKGDGAQLVAEQANRSNHLRRLLPWLLGVCLVGFLGLVAILVYEAFGGSNFLARATPTSAYLAGTEVKLVGPDGKSVTVWQVGGNCEVRNAFGQVPPASDARILDDGCYNPESRIYYHRIALVNGSTGWVEADDIVPATEYTPPAPTATPKPTGTPRPTPTLPPTPTPPPAPLPQGSPLSAGNWRVRVDKVEIAESLSPPSGDRTTTAEGRFALVFLTATNQGRGSETLHASTVYVEDAEGSRYANDDLASAYASSAGCLDFALDVEPGGSTCIVAVFDISDQSSFYILSLFGADERILLEVP
jgi:hypothetical protein